MEGDIENIDGRPLITRVRVKYHLTIPRGKQAEAERALAVSWEGELVEE